MARTDWNERSLIEAVQADPSRFGELYELHFDRVYAYISRRVRGNRPEAQDLTSEVFHQALANLHRYEWRGIPFAIWLYRIAANKIADHCQRLARDRDLPPPAEFEEPDYEETERLALLFSAVRQLPEDQRRVIEMRFTGDLSIRQVAEQLQRSEGAVKQLQSRGLDNLRALMGEHHD